MDSFYFIKLARAVLAKPPRFVRLPLPGTEARRYGVTERETEAGLFKGRVQGFVEPELKRAGIAYATSATFAATFWNWSESGDSRRVFGSILPSGRYGMERESRRSAH